MATPSTLSDTQRRVTARLGEAGIDTPALDARLLISAATGLDETQMARQPERAVSAEEAATLADFVSQRCDRRPVSKILGARAFWHHTFIVSDDVLDPRPDSEILIEAVLARLPDSFAGRLIDLGTGSGCLLLSLLAERSQATGLGIDISREALGVAEANARHLGLEARVEFRHGDWLQDVTVTTPSLFPADMIIANPPYITTQEMSELAPEVARFDPTLALHGGADGLDPYRAILADAPPLLADQGWLIFEIGYTQGAAVKQMMQAHGFDQCAVMQDLAAHDRIVVGKKK